jgi:CTP-dependent riboflavin kinase
MAMHAEVIHGVVVSGKGGASRAMVGEKLADRSEIAGVPLVPGTLNVLPPQGDGMAVSVLGTPAHESETGSPIGTLRWWPVTLRIVAAGVDHPAWVVRHERTGTRHLEIVADVRFRDAGVHDGMATEVERR